MADLYIDGAVFARMRTNLGRVEELLERPGRELAQLDDSCVGADALRVRMAEFGEEWSYGIGQLGKFSGDASAALAQIEAAFAEVDAKLSQALGGGGGVPHVSAVGQGGRSRGFGPGFCASSPLRVRVLPALGFDPTPGDHSAVGGAVSTLREASRALGEIATVLRGSGDDVWRGQAAAAFRELMVSELRPRVEKAAEAFGGAVYALEGWVSFMGDAQATTRRLERDAADALAELGRAQGTVDTAAAASPPGTPALDDPAARRLLDGQVIDLAAATRTLSNAQDRLDQTRRTAGRHGQEHQARGSEVARALKSAIDAAPNEPGFWSSLGDSVGNVMDKAGNFLSGLPEKILAKLKDFAPVLQLIGDVAGMLGTVAGLLALVPGLQFLAVPALVLGVVALGAHYLQQAGRDGSFASPLKTRDVILDAVGVVAGAGALKAGTSILKAARAAGMPTRTVPQLIGDAKELPLGYFDFARGTGVMAQSEFVPRLGSYAATSSSVSGVVVGSPDGIGDLDNWSHFRFLKPIEEPAP